MVSSLDDVVTPMTWATLNTNTNANDFKFTLNVKNDIANEPVGRMSLEAKLMSDAYKATGERASYFQHGFENDNDAGGNIIPTLYERYHSNSLNQFSDFFTMYQPVMKTNNNSTSYSYNNNLCLVVFFSEL